MATREEYNEIVKSLGAILPGIAGKRGTITVSPEVAALLKRIDEPETAATPKTKAKAAAAPASPPASAPQTEEPSQTPAKASPAADAPPLVIAAPEPAAPEVIRGLAAVEEEVRGCRKCRLCETRTKTVFGDGHPHAALVFVGEAPGADEDAQGIPFVGRAGQLLTDIIVKGMQISRKDVYICNVIKCRPPENRDPHPDEKLMCEPYLIQQLALIQPRVICALGTHAAHSLLKVETPIGRLRGVWHTYQGIPLRATYHPAYLLRNPADKRKTWEDIQVVMRFLAGEDTGPIPSPQGVAG